jgi:hypothetical protein
MHGKIVSLVFFTVLLLPRVTEAEAGRIYIQGGSGSLAQEMPLINPGVTVLALISKPDLTDLSFLTYAALARRVNLQSQHLTVGYETLRSEDSWWRIGLTRSKYESHPYNPGLDAFFLQRHFNPDYQQLPQLDQMFLMLVLSDMPETISRESVSGVAFETYSMEIGYKREWNIGSSIRPFAGIDGGLGRCVIREGCMAYSLNPFIGISVKTEAATLSFTGVRRYVWLEFGPLSYTMNIQGVDSYLLSVSKDVALFD